MILQLKALRLSLKDLVSFQYLKDFTNISSDQRELNRLLNGDLEARQRR